ncbi:putative efflux pump membrane fusion protein [Shimia thalassica]|uniref:Putative efflux pump membrane fusion protein n=1 Tax=Shimia thalassica TaxID=1715693 RepID=A0A0P1I776_9RHOB|nr:putative efflux pump membrane fusion protein [Shimia thalassica]
MSSWEDAGLDGDVGKDPEPAKAAGKASAIVDRALWSYLTPDAQLDEFTGAWLALLCQFVGGVKVATLVMPSPDTSKFVPVAIWPENGDMDEALTSTVERAMSEKQGVLREVSIESGEVCLAYPYVLDDRLLGVVALHLSKGGEVETRRIMRHLQWAAGWIELLERRDALSVAERERDQGRVALDVLVAMLEKRDHKSASIAVATSTAAFLGLERVSIGLVKRRGIKITALSHSAEVGTQLQLSQALKQAMLETLDQAAPILRSVTPENDDAEDPYVSRAHDALIRGHGAMSVFTLPLYDANDQVVGAMTFEHRDANGLTEDKRNLARGIAALVGPILQQKRKNDRAWPVRALQWVGGLAGALLGPARIGLKLFVLVVVAVGFFLSRATTEFQIPADAKLEGVVQRVISAPFDGYLVDQAVRPGDRVQTGDVLAQIDDQDLRLQLLAVESELAERQIELNAAVAGARRTDQALLNAQIRQVLAQRDLLETQLSRTVLRAPFDGVVVSGDRSQQLGSAVARGEELFVVAPLGAYRLRLLVDERDIAELAKGQVGEVRFSAQPDEEYGFSVQRILSVADVSAGANRFGVEARMQALEGENQGLLLPGMEGVARVTIDTRLLVDVWTRDALNWFKLALWRWMP